MKALFYRNGLRKKEGYSAINVIVSVMVLLLTMNLLVELTLLGQRYSFMAQTTSYIARVVGAQGGIRTSIPPGYPRLDRHLYTTSSTFFDVLDDGFRKAGFDSWTVTINNRTLTRGSNIAINEKNIIDVRVRAGFFPVFNWRNNSNTQVFVQTRRITYSTFTPRNDPIRLIK